jgi:flagellar biosynthesis GTPase FlhF
MYFSHNDLHPDFVVPVSQHDSLSTIKEKIFKIKGICCTWFEPRWGCSLVRPEAPTCTANFEYPHGFIVHHHEEDQEEEEEEEEEEDQEDQNKQEQEEDEEEEEEEEEDQDKQEQEEHQDKQDQEDNQEEDNQEEDNQEEDQQEEQEKEEKEQPVSCASISTQERRARWTCTIC